MEFEMELMTVIAGVIVLGLAYAGWVWWKDGKTWRPLYIRVRRSIRSAIDAVSQEEMGAMQNRIRDNELQCENRLTKLETVTKFSTQLQYVSKEFERRLTLLEQSQNLSDRSSGLPAHIFQPRSLVCLGVRVTLSDQVWTHLGAEGAEEIDDHLLERLIQGPFCPVCLKKVCGRGRQRELDVVPAQCQFCGVSWDYHETVTYPMALVDCKRKIYQHLDDEYRAGGKM